ncbi:MAG: hypothetical protein CL593_06120 [Alteromonas sp.]|uniref:glycosyltransferase n=1 Tax=Alteromonas australica TaxID=589873 RepID=UPI000C5E5B8C|nr:glycosyltransferase [Alteromonas australica]MAB92912.1 hypothetical protein [Alteromonas sp.]|tara:strand:+ start:350 stop:1327 length:978 start_codon:yes stop_codon:yes gene_type:complete
MNSIKYSIIIPVFNNQIGINQIVDTFVSMNCLDVLVELIIVDDGSITPIVVEELKGVNLIRQDNTGVSGARNNGINASKGEYVAFLDSDDFYDSDVIGMWESATKSSLNAEMLIFDSRIVDRINNKTLYQTHKCAPGLYRSADALKYYFNKEIFSHICSILCKREFLLNKGVFFNQKLALSEDVLFMVECIKNADWVHIDQRRYYNYLIHKGSVTNVVATEKVLNHFEAFDVIKKIPVSNSTTIYKNYFVATMYLNYLFKLISNKCNSERVINETLVRRKYLQVNLKSSVSIRYFATLAFKILSYLPAAILKPMLVKACKVRHEY